MTAPFTFRSSGIWFLRRCPSSTSPTPASSRAIGNPPTCLQSLYLLNNKQVQELSDAFARRVYASAKDQPGRIQFAFWTALGRAPTAEEVRAAYTFFSEYTQDAAKAKSKGADLTPYAWSAFCQSLMASAEFRHLD
nr:DUF1553 domain-containing protein [Verrucomicrobium spinosum]